MVDRRYNAVAGAKRNRVMRNRALGVEMNLTKHTDYALRVLVYLAVSEEEPVTAARIASRFDVSEHHLTKVVQTLAAHDYVLAVRGRKGGVRLNRAPEDIRLGEVVRDCERSFELTDCFAQDGDGCVIMSNCRFRPILTKALDRFLETLNEYTLRDLLRSKKRLRLALGLQTA